VKKSILVIDADKEQGRELCELLKASQFKVVSQYSTHNLEEKIKDTGCQAILWDIDTVPVDNRTVRELARKFPRVYFFCLSKQPLHPELKDAISHHIYACLNRPIDADELFFWLRSIGENQVNSSRTSTH
jgi:DNA-binding NtrC family response regulator